MVNFQTLEERVRAQLDEEEVDGFFSSEEIRNWINEGLKDVARKAKHLKQTSYFDIENGEERYKLPVDFIREFKVKMDDDILSRIQIEDVGDEKGYFIWDTNVITISPSGIEGRLYLYYYRYPKTMDEDEDEPELDNGYQSLLIDYAVYKAKKKDNRYEEAQMNYQKYSIDLQGFAQSKPLEPRRNQVKVVRR